jgi:methyl-accepting chemotaxis protein
MFNIRAMSITRKLAILTVCAVAGIAILTGIFLYSERALIVKEREASVRQAVETAHGVLVHFHTLASQGKMSEQEARQAAAKALNGLRYSGNEYFWINDMQPKMVMHPIKPELDGQDLSANKDPTGKRLFVEFVEMVKRDGAGFVFYLWPKPGNDTPVQKVSYVKGFAPWGWVIGSGVYIDSVEATIAKRIVEFSGGALLLAACLIGVCIAIGRSLLHQLGGEPEYAADIARRIADGDLTVEVGLKPGDNSSLLYTIDAMRKGLPRSSARCATVRARLSMLPLKSPRAISTCQYAPSNSRARWSRRHRPWKN